MEGIDFDHHSADFVTESHEVYESLRSKCPVAYSPNHGGFWVAAEYDTVFEIARDDATFSSSREVVVPATDVGRLIPLQCDPPEPQRYRSVLQPFFTPNALKAVEPYLARLVEECFDSFIEDGTAEVVENLAAPVPSKITMHLLGLDPADWALFAGPLHASSYSRPGTAENDDARAEVQAFSRLIMAAVDERIASPRDDMISAILAAAPDGTPISRQEAIDLVRMVIFGGMDTVMAAISNIFVQFGRHTDLVSRLVAEPELIGSAIGEFLRFDAPVQGFARTVTRDTTVGEASIKAGETVLMLWASANRDPKVFGDDAGELRLDRSPNRHMTFGIGAHRCLGSTLARMELRAILETVCRRIPDVKVDLERVGRPDTIGIVKGHRSVPITFTPGRRSDSSTRIRP